MFLDNFNLWKSRNKVFAILEFQQVVIGLKREHEDNITRLIRGREVQMFKLRGEHAHILHEYEKRISELEETIKKLKQELEKQKTLADIQVRLKVCKNN